MPKTNHQGCVLLVDDDDAIRESLGELLESCGFKIFTANCVDNGIKVIETNNEIEAIISDLKMPGKTGHELLKYLNDVKKTIPLIFLTGYATLESCQEAVRDGAFDYILKPIESKDKVIYPLNHAIEKRRMEIKMIELQRDIIVMAEEHQAILDELLMDAEMKDKVQSRINQILDKWDTKKK
ncbi:MAG: response regulator [Candidatus Omnitrophica bacterium]|nr:response regulator [Candidatus Omnitrophota bacterium]